MPNINKLYKDLKENYPNGCETINCIQCPFNESAKGSPEKAMCDLMSNLITSNINWKWNTMPTVQEFINYINENYPHGCEEETCKTCPLFRGKDHKPNGKLCRLLESLIEQELEWTPWIQFKIY